MIALVRKGNEMNKELFNNLTSGDGSSRVLALIKSCGLDKIVVNYSGGGDSGGMENMEFYPDDAISKTVKDVLESSLEDALCDPIYSKHGSFADGGGYYVNGRVTWDAKNEIVTIDGTDYITEYTWNDDEDEEYEGEESEIPWEEVLYSKEDLEEDLDYGKDYELVYIYSQIFGKLPEEFHNQMLTIAATNEDEDAKNYIKSV